MDYSLRDMFEELTKSPHRSVADRGRPENVFPILYPVVAFANFNAMVPHTAASAPGDISIHFRT